MSRLWAVDGKGGARLERSGGRSPLLLLSLLWFLPGFPVPLFDQYPVFAGHRKITDSAVPSFFNPEKAVRLQIGDGPAKGVGGKAQGLGFLVRKNQSAIVDGLMGALPVDGFFSDTIPRPNLEPGAEVDENQTSRKR